MSDNLTPNERRFVREYAADRNATRAYLRAFGDTKADGSPRSYDAVRSAASRLLTNVNIRAELEAADRDHRRSCRVNTTRTLRELAAIGYADAGDVFREDLDGSPTPRRWEDVDPVTRRTLKSVKIRRKRRTDEQGRTWETEEVVITFHDKLAALDKLGRHLGLFSTNDALSQLLDRLEGDEGLRQ